MFAQIDFFGGSSQPKFPVGFRFHGHVGKRRAVSLPGNTTSLTRSE
jgi:hypothetical protein